MGIAAEHISEKYNLSREAQDDFAISSYKRAQAAAANHHFHEIEPIEVAGAKGKPAVLVKDDEDAKNVPFPIHFRLLMAVKRGKITRYKTSF
jgi:acetyl-CoA C-acetyltransferase